MRHAYTLSDNFAELLVYLPPGAFATHAKAYQSRIETAPTVDSAKPETLPQLYSETDY